MDLNNTKVLIVDGNKDQRYLMKISLLEYVKEMEVVFSDTSDDCLHKLSESNYDLLIVDYKLDGPNGLDLLRTVTQKKYDVPVMMVTAFGNEDIAVEAVKLGACDYIAKSNGYLAKLTASALKILKEHSIRREIDKVEEKATEAESKYQKLVENIIDIIFIADKELNFITINPACQRIFECSVEDAKKINMYDLVHDVDKDMIVDNFRRTFLSKIDIIEGLEFRIKAKSGNVKHVELNAKLFYDIDEKSVQVEGVIRDITERKQIEQKLFKIEKLNALELQSSGIAHEFNNLLTIILGYLNILNLKIKSADTQVINALNVIEKAVKDGAAIVDRVHKLSKVKSDYIQIIQVDVVVLLNEAVEFTMPRWRNEAKAKGIDYEVSTDNLVASKYYIRSNPLELREVFSNIINNCIDAMPDGGKVEFSIRASTDNVEITITDNGVGISDDIKDKIFGPFFTTKGPDGSGLGLSVAHSIINKYGGVINIDSSIKGTSVHVMLPLYSQEITVYEEEDEDVLDYKARILIIEDEEVILEMLQIILEEKGHKVVVALDANEGLNLFQKDRFDVVLCDLAMPDINGWKVAKIIKTLDEDRNVSKTPVIMMTGYELDTDILNYKKEGVDLILKKPIDFEELNKIVINLVREKI